MIDPSLPETRRPAPSGPDRVGTDVLAEALHRFGDSELAFCAAVALTARVRCGDRPCRVQFSGAPTDGTGGASGAERAASGDDEREWRRIPVRGPATPVRPEAWLAVEVGGAEGEPPDPDRLSPLADLAGLVLERSRLAREARRARSEADDVRALIGHALRGHLHAALLRADNLLLDMRQGDPPDLAEVVEQLEVLKAKVEDMVGEIREVLDEPADGSGAAARVPAGSREEVRVPELLRAAADGERAGDDPPDVHVEGDVPDVRADPDRLGPALGELFDLARRSVGSSALSVRRDDPSSGVRIDLSIALPPFSRARDDGADAGAGSPNGDRRSSARDPDERGDDRPSLRETVTELGGELRVVAGEGTRATVVVIIPPGAAG